MKVLEFITNNYKIIISVVIICLLIYFIYLYNGLKTSIIEGMWEADGSFCEESDIEGMNLMIGKNDVGTYRACLIMMAENKIIVDETFDISFGIMIPRLFQRTSVQLNWDNELMPKKMNANIDLVSGKMSWFDDKKEYARFVRKY